MKMKITLVLIFFIILLIFSYSKMNKEEINYTLLGEKELFSNNIISKNFSDLIYDELNEQKNFGFYSKDFIDNDLRIIDLINIIEENQKRDGIAIQNILKRTNLLILHIGSNEINYKLSKVDSEENNDKIIYEYLDEVISDFSKLIEKIRKYNSGNIYILGYYNNTDNKNNDKYYKYINDKIYSKYTKKDIKFINLYDILNKNEDYLDGLYITNNGNLALFNKIYDKINAYYLHKIS